MGRIALKPGEHMAAQTKPERQANGSYFGRFSLRLMDGKTVRLKVTAPTVGEWHTKALAAAEEALRAAGTEGSWKPTSQMSEYIKRVSVPAVKVSTLRDRSKTKYEHLLDILGEHFKGYAIHDAVRFRRLETVLKDIASEHGAESGRNARNVLSKWVVQQLIRDEVIPANPLAGMRIDLGNEKKKAKSAGGQALTDAEYERALEYLLGLDVEDVRAPKQGKYTLADRIEFRRTTVELTLLQAVTGFRIGEALSLRLDEVDDDGQKMTVSVPAERSKTHRGRTVPVLDQRVADRLRVRLKRRQKGTLVFPAPAVPDSPWDQSNAQKAVKKLLGEVSEACSIPLLSEVSSHVWRATLNTRAMNAGVPAEIRAAYFGHTAKINELAYTDVRDTSTLVQALGR